MGEISSSGKSQNTVRYCVACTVMKSNQSTSHLIEASAKALHVA